MNSIAVALPIVADEGGGECALDASEWRRLADSLGLPAREARVVQLILAGKKDKQIAADMKLRVPTVRTYLTRIFSRTEWR